MSLNDDQRDHVRSLARLPDDARCWHGWCVLPYRLYCSSPSPCPPDASLADRLRTEQPCCGRPAGRPDDGRTSGSHYAGCKLRHRDAFLVELGLVDLGGEA